MPDDQSHPPANEQTIIDSIARGDAGAFESAYRAHKDPLLTVLVMAFGLDRSAAEDVLHDVFTQLARQATSIQLAGSLRGYLAACCKNRARDIARRDQRRRNSIETCQPATADSNDAESILEHSETIDHACRLLNQLPDDQRKVVALHLQGELTFREIADALGIPLNTAKSRYRYAIDKLRELWESASTRPGETHVR